MGEKLLKDPREEDLKSELEYLNAQRKKWNYFALGLLVLCFWMISSSFLLWGFLYFLPFVGLFAGLLGVAAWANADEVEKRAKRLSARLAEDFTKIPDQIDVRELGRLERAVWPRQIIAAAIWGTIITWSNYIYASFIPGMSFLHISMWLGVLAGILFGAWGVAAAYIGTTIGNIPVFGLETSALQSIGIFFAASISAWAFRLFRGDPRLKNSREGFLFMMFGVVLPSLAYALVTPSILSVYGFYPMSALINVVIPSWFLGTTILAIIFGFPMLLVSSRMVVNIGAYCRGWFS
jgi:hypothetical protein